MSLAIALMSLTSCSNESPTGTIPVVPGKSSAVRTGAAVLVPPNGATLTGTIYPRGGKTDYWFEFGTTTAYGAITVTQTVGAGSDPVALKADISGLTPGAQYHYRLWGTIWGVGTDAGDDQSFTNVFLAPFVTRDSVQGTSASSVMLGGTVNPDGTQTSYHFEYGSTSAYGQSTSTMDAGSGTVTVRVRSIINNLSSGGSYHWRLVASNAVGATATPDSTFITPVDISFPLAIGTTWTYRYASRNGSPFQITDIVGLHTWRVESVAPGPNSTAYVISDSKRDTLTWVYPVGQPDSLFTSTTTFTIVLDNESISCFPPEFFGQLLKLPRFLQGTNDTLRISVQGQSEGQTVEYVKGVGLCRSSCYVQVGHYGSSGSLELISLSKP